MYKFNVTPLHHRKFNTLTFFQYKRTSARRFLKTMRGKRINCMFFVKSPVFAPFFRCVIDLPYQRQMLLFEFHSTFLLQLLSTLSQTSPCFYASAGSTSLNFENTMRKGEIARNEQFLLYPYCFLPSRITFPYSMKFRIVVCKLSKFGKV